MELDLLQISSGFAAGLILGVVLMLIFNKVKSGSASPGSVKHEFDEYKNEVEAHFEATSKKFRNMTEQYQDLYQHLSVGAASLCRPDSVAATLADDSDPKAKPAQLESSSIKDQEQGADDEPNSELASSEPLGEAESESPKAASQKANASDSKEKSQPAAKEPSAQSKEPSAPSKESEAKHSDQENTASSTDKKSAPKV